MLAQVELEFNSVERIVEYLEVPQEAPAMIEDSRPPAAWPTSDGDLVVEDLVVRYAPHLPAVLKNLSFRVKSAEKVGIVSGPVLCSSTRCRNGEPLPGRSDGRVQGSRRWPCRY